MDGLWQIIATGAGILLAGLLVAVWAALALSKRLDEEEES